jgi:O-antigen ligase
LLEILLEGGIVALAAALWIALAVAGAGIKMLRSIPFLQEPLALGFLAGLCALGIHCLIDVPQWSNSLLAAIYIAAVMTQAGEGQRSTRRGGIRQPLTGTIIDGHEG